MPKAAGHGVEGHAGVEEVGGVHVAQVVDPHAGDPGRIAEPAPGSRHVIGTPGVLTPVVGEDVGQLVDGRATRERRLDLRSAGRQTSGCLHVDGDGPFAVGLGVLDQDLVAGELEH